MSDAEEAHVGIMEMINYWEDAVNKITADTKASMLNYLNMCGKRAGYLASTNAAKSICGYKRSKTCKCVHFK